MSLHLTALLVVALLVRRLTRSPSKPPLQALLFLVTPTCSLWSKNYLALRHSGNTVKIPLRTLIKDLVSGKMELRAPEQDLHKLLTGKLHVQEMTLVLSVGPVLRLRALWWWVKSRIHPGRYKDCVSSELLPLQVESRSTSLLPALLPTLSPHVQVQLSIATTLDSTPHQHFASALHRIQSSTPPGHLFLLEFTSWSASASTHWVLAALPFFAFAGPRVSPFGYALPGTIAALEAGHGEVLSVQNVSGEYALVLDRDARAGEAQGASGEVLGKRWEAACYRGGVLARWVVCVRR